MSTPFNAARSLELIAEMAADPLKSCTFGQLAEIAEQLNTMVSLINDLENAIVRYVAAADEDWKMLAEIKRDREDWRAAYYALQAEIRALRAGQIPMVTTKDTP